MKLVQETKWAYSTTLKLTLGNDDDDDCNQWFI